MTGIPRLSHLQFLVVGLLRGRTLPGREIRDGLEQLDVRKSGPAFYQLMSRLEDGGLVTGQYHQEIVSGQIIRFGNKYKVAIKAHNLVNTDRPDFVCSVPEQVLPCHFIFSHRVEFVVKSQRGTTRRLTGKMPLG